MDQRTPATEKRGSAVWVKYLFAAWVAASLLFAHGCHGDEDHELFTSCLAWIANP